MSDTKTWIEDVRRTPPPDLWNDIESKASMPLADPNPRPATLTRIAAVLLAILVVGSTIYALRGLGDDQGGRPAAPAPQIVRYSLPGPAQPISVGEGAAWVKVGSGSGTVNGFWRIDAENGEVREVDVPGGLWSAVAGGSAWLLCEADCGGGNVIQLDPATGEVRKMLTLRATPLQIDGVADGVWITTDDGVFLN